MGLFSSLTKPSWEKARRRADKATDGGDFASAFKLYDEALQGCPDEVRAELETAREAASSKLYELNVQAAEEALNAGQLDDALDHYELALRFAVDDEQRERARQALRRATQQTFRQEEAEIAADDSLPGDEPVDPDAIFTLLLSDLPEDVADVYEGLGDDFRDAYILAQNGETEAALTAFRALLDEDPDSPVVRFETGNALLALGRADEAVEELQQAAERLESFVDIKLSLAEAAWQLERWELAEEVLQRAVDTTQDDPRVYAAIARTALLTDSPDYGLEAADAGLELDPLNRDLTLLRGLLLELAERPDEALECFETLVERYWRFDGETGTLQFDRQAGLRAARLLFRTDGDLERAEELMRAAIHVTDARDRWRHEIQLAEILGKAGQADESESMLREASRAIPEEEPLWRMRVADLLGDEAEVARLLETLDEAQRELWESRQTG